MRQRPFSMRTRHIKKHGFSILELLLALSIVVIVVSLAIPAYNFFKRKSEDAVCMSNLRGLHAGFSSYLHDHQFIWPKNPFLEKTGGSDADSDEAKWWFEQLKEYGPTRESWLCPSERSHFVEDNDPDFFSSTYVPTSFDQLPNTAYRYASQPWVIERGGFHEKGMANAIFPDGHISKKTAPGGPDTVKK